MSKKKKEYLVEYNAFFEKIIGLTGQHRCLNKSTLSLHKFKVLTSKLEAISIYYVAPVKVSVIHLIHEPIELVNIDINKSTKIFDSNT